MKTGGKAGSLKKLLNAEFNVPHFFICDGSWSEEKILETVDKELLGSSYFAVRSSAAGEDGDKKSYAGHFYSAIAIKRNDLAKEVKKVISSFADFSGSVIIQEFIPSDVSGVSFSDNGEGLILVNSNFGLCKNVVEGKACDEYVLNKEGDLIRESVSKNKPVLTLQDGKLQESERSEPSISSAQLDQVVKLAKKAESFFKKPQDIEWCYLGEKLYLLQSRPVTANIAVPEEEYYDSANIAESYSGIVLPLTASFAELVYKQVYIDFLRMSGVPVAALTKHSYVFENLLGFFHGRMYYNMNNWYRMAQFVPGYKRNKENFETMITSNLRKEIATTIRPNFFFRFYYPIIVLFKIPLFSITSKIFKNHTQRHIKRLKKTKFSDLSLEECKNLFNFLQNNLLRKWYITLENDFFVMTYLGILQKLYPEDNLQEIFIFKSKATEQVGYLQDLSEKMQGDAELWAAVLVNDGKSFFAKLANNPVLQSEYDRYIAMFGGRFANELKLETVGLDEDPRKFMTVLRAYSGYKTKVITHKDEGVLDLPFFKKILFKHSLKKFKKYASQREEFRLLRSNMFSITRSVFRRVGVILHKNKVLKNADDVFYLTIDEVLAIANEQITANLAAEIVKRKQKFDEYKKENPPSHFLAFGGEMIDNTTGSDLNASDSRGVSPGVVSGRIKVMKEFDMPDKVDFEILVTKHTDPGWTALIALSKGLIIEHGGVLSHASIVARELGIPAVIGVHNATELYKDGQSVEINGSTGTIKII
jgi:pyruvate,water dikinase